MNVNCIEFFFWVFFSSVSLSPKRLKNNPSLSQTKEGCNLWQGNCSEQPSRSQCEGVRTSYEKELKMLVDLHCLSHHPLHRDASSCMHSDNFNFFQGAICRAALYFSFGPLPTDVHRDDGWSAVHAYSKSCRSCTLTFQIFVNIRPAHEILEQASSFSALHNACNIAENIFHDFNPPGRLHRTDFGTANSNPDRPTEDSTCFGRSVWCPRRLSACALDLLFFWSADAFLDRTRTRGSVSIHNVISSSVLKTQWTRKSSKT